jgi:peptide/nickel transport system substrate-binding protein
MGRTRLPADAPKSIPAPARTVRRGSARPVPAAIGIGAVMALTAACGGTSTSQSAAVSGTLTVAVPAAPPTLDPTKSNGHAGIFFNELAYEPLILLGSDGSYRPGLASSWAYVGTGNTQFVLTLRQGVTFSDGSALTAQNVVDHFHYLATSSGQVAPLFAGDTFTATSPTQVTIKTAKPNPDLVYQLTQDVMAGQVISDPGLKNPAALGTKTYGAGPYELSDTQSSSGSQYTYVPNPHYYDKTAQHWKKVVIKIIASPQSTLQSMLNGQVDIAIGDQTTLAEAKQTGLARPSSTITSNVTGVTLADRGGKLSKPLGDKRVRQALNYATDRDAIVKALFPGNKPTVQMSVPGADGYDAGLEQTYPYDPAKAKALLAQAGYPNGLSFELTTTDANSQSLFAQALAKQWEAVGVKVKIHDIAQGNAYVAQALGGKTPAFTNNYAILPVATEGPNLFLPNAAYNPSHYSDPVLQDLYNQDIRTTGAAKKDLDKKIVAHLVNEAWFVPVVAQGLSFYSTKKVTGTDIAQNTPFLSLYDVRPAS